MKKRDYTRRGPVGVVAQNVAKALRHSHLAAARLDGWVSCSDDPVLAQASGLALQVRADAASLAELVDRLVESGFVPPVRDASLAAGETVAVKPEHRRRYEAAYEDLVRVDPGALDRLTVDRVLDTGDVLVRRGERTPFPVRKSHLTRVRRES